jgi:PPK2 family polyphosphate:nucleotide phosphotransferase
MAPSGSPTRQPSKKALAAVVGEINELQRILYAHDTYAVLLVFQAMDAAGKDSTIRAVTTGVNPAGFQVYSFKRPSSEELDHDFLWRTSQRLPERGRIGIFNRSYYEEVLVVRVRPDLLQHQRLETSPTIWDDRLTAIREHERHLVQSRTIVLKFWLNVSQDEQKSRFISRLRDPRKNWKFVMSDLKERRKWDDYMAVYEAALNGTSRPWAPWYAIPADDKPSMRLMVAEIVAENMKQLDLRYPEADPEVIDNMDAICRELDAG